MQHPAISKTNAKMHYDQLYQEAESHRNFKRLEFGKAGLIAQIVSALGNMFAQRNHHSSQSQSVLDVRKRQNA